MRLILNSFIVVIFCVVFFSPAVFAAGGDLPSQKARFEGMGATFKAKKKEAADKAAAEKLAQEKKQAEENEAAAEEAKTYFKLHTFVVNVIDQNKKDKLLFLTLDVFCEIKQADDRWIIDEHIAPLKDTIISYISGLKRQAIQTQKQKKSLQQELTKRVQKVLKKQTGSKVISQLYLTKFLIQ